ncbi:MAG TPA: hypothetical protein VF546_14045 [Pyrinomonadaceae bacterium]
MSARPEPAAHAPAAPAQSAGAGVAALLAGRRAVRYHPEFAQIGGSGNAGVLLSQLWYWQDKATLPGGWVWKSAREWQAETGLTRREQQTAIKRLVACKLVETHRRSRRAPLYYRLNTAELRARLGQLINSARPRLVAAPANTAGAAVDGAAADATAGATSVADRCDSVCTFGASGDAPIRHTSEITRPETTGPESTHTLPRAREAPPDGGGVCVPVALSRHPKETCVAWAEHRRAAGARIDAYAVGTARWRDATADDEIAAWLARTPEAAAAAGRRQEPQTLFFGEAAQIVNAITVAHGRDPAAVIAELPVAEDVRARLYARFRGHEARAPQGGPR